MAGWGCTWRTSPFRQMRVVPQMTPYHKNCLASEVVRCGASQKRVPRDSTKTYSPWYSTFWDVPQIAAYHAKLITPSNYIIPPIPAAPAGIPGRGLSSFFSANTHSVVRNIEAIDAAFSNATRDTFVGSMIPAASISS